MFEHFSAGARRAVVDAQEIAYRLNAPEIDSPHLLAGALAAGKGEMAWWFIERGLTGADFLDAVTSSGLVAAAPTERPLPFSSSVRGALIDLADCRDRQQITRATLVEGLTSAAPAATREAVARFVPAADYRADPDDVAPFSPTDRRRRALNEFECGARRSGLDLLERLVSDDEQDYEAAALLARALLVVGRFDQAVVVALQSVRAAPDPEAARSHNLLTLLCHPTPGYAASALRSDRVARGQLGDEYVATIVRRTKARTSPAAVESWWRVLGSGWFGSMTGSLWSAASLAAHRAGDSTRALGAERRAMFADPTSPLLQIARVQLGLATTTSDPCFETHSQVTWLTAMEAMGEAPRSNERMVAALARCPDNPLLIRNAARREEAWLGGDTAAMIAVTRELLARPTLTGSTRSLLVNQLAWAYAIQAAAGGEPPHPDGLACADLFGRGQGFRQTWSYRDTVALVRATDGDLDEAELLLQATGLATAPSSTKESVALTAAHIAYRRGRMDECRRLLAAAGTTAASEPHGRWLIERLP
jgi:tetratricopeptide (TPR) repeat protein